MADHSADAREPLVGVSLKMFLGYAESLRYVAGVASAAPGFAGVGVFVLPSFPVIAEAAGALRGTAVAYGAQDGHWEQSGAYTGCVSPSLLRELGCTFMEVGHAERRRLFGEDDAMTARKAGAAVAAGLVPVICIGEEEAGGDAAARAVAQAGAVLAGLPADATAVIAYEPIWAIGAEAPGRRASYRAGRLRPARLDLEQAGASTPAVRRQRRGRAGGGDHARGARRRLRRAWSARARGPLQHRRRGPGGSMSETIAIGCDEAGLELKAKLVDELQRSDRQVVDYGCTADYPEVALAVAGAIARGEHERGILICGTGIGMAIAANKVPGVYAAQVHDSYSAERSRKSNNAQIMTLGALIVGPALAVSLLHTWLASEFQGGGSARKVAKIAEAERRARDA